MAVAFQKALAEDNVAAPYDEVMARIKRRVGGAAKLYAAEHGLDHQVIFDRYQVHEHAMPDDTILPYEGMCALLRDAHDAGYRHFLYTHRDHTALSALRRHGVYELFSGFVTELDGFPSKPAPDALNHILAKHRLVPSESIMLGDRSIDIQSARNAGIAGCLFDPEHFYDDFENELRVDSVDALRKLLEI
jgi:HAD superfamily hydrolase (TIGR01549 family)